MANRNNKNGKQKQQKYKMRMKNWVYNRTDK